MYRVIDPTGFPLPRQTGGLRGLERRCRIAGLDGAHSTDQ
jgi:hypothetical protein